VGPGLLQGVQGQREGSNEGAEGREEGLAED
jgi:hypothetical protein